jgi:hypothetical protein
MVNRTFLITDLKWMRRHRHINSTWLAIHRIFSFGSKFVSLLFFFLLKNVTCLYLIISDSSHVFEYIVILDPTGVEIISVLKLRYEALGIYCFISETIVLRNIRMFISSSYWNRILCMSGRFFDLSNFLLFVIFYSNLSIIRITDYNWT